ATHRLQAKEAVSRRCVVAIALPAHVLLKILGPHIGHEERRRGVAARRRTDVGSRIDRAAAEQRDAGDGGTHNERSDRTHLAPQHIPSRKSGKLARATRHQARDGDESETHVGDSHHRVHAASLRSTALRVGAAPTRRAMLRSEEHTSELQSPCNLVCRLLLEKKKQHHITPPHFQHRDHPLYMLLPTPPFTPPLHRPPLALPDQPLTLAPLRHRLSSTRLPAPP